MTIIKIKLQSLAAAAAMPVWTHVSKQQQFSNAAATQYTISQCVICLLHMNRIVACKCNS